jgi:hypothetical protein
MKDRVKLVKKAGKGVEKESEERAVAQLEVRPVRHPEKQIPTSGEERTQAPGPSGWRIGLIGNAADDGAKPADLTKQIREPAPGLTGIAEGIGGGSLPCDRDGLSVQQGGDKSNEHIQAEVPARQDGVQIELPGASTAAMSTTVGAKDTLADINSRMSRNLLANIAMGNPLIITGAVRASFTDGL